MKFTHSLPNNPKFPNLPTKHILATNLLITLVHQAIYLQEKKIARIKEKHKSEGASPKNFPTTEKSTVSTKLKTDNNY